MIGIDRVRQTVLTILNKENRGWLPPDRFNYISGLAQNSIFSKLINEEAHYLVSPKGNEMLSASIEEMIDIFKRREAVTDATGRNTFNLPETLYRLDSLEYTYKSKIYTGELVRASDIQNISNTDKVMLSPVNPKFIRTGDSVIVYTGESVDVSASNVNVWFIKEPNTPIWGSLEIGSSRTPEYSASRSTDFELHPALEDRLIKEILFYAGVTIREENVSSAIGQSISADEQIKKN